MSQLEQLNQPAAYWEHAVELASNGNPDKPAWLTNLGNALTHRFRCTSQLLDIDRAIDCYDRALTCNPESEGLKHIILANLARALQDRFEASQESEDIERAIACQEQVVSHIPEEHPQKSSRLASLSYFLEDRFDLLGQLQDLDMAIARLDSAIALSSSASDDVPRWLANLGNLHKARYERQGLLGDLDKAVACLERATQSGPDHSRRTAWIEKLGNLLRLRFDQQGMLADIDRAITILDQTSQVTPEDHPEKAELLDTLGICLMRRFERQDKLADIDKAIDTQTAAVSLTSDDDPSKPARLNNLGNSFQSRFDNRGNTLDIDMAIASHHQSKALTPEGDADLVGRLNNLGVSLRLRFELLGNLEDLQDAVQALEDAMQIMPENYADKNACLFNLGISYMFRFIRLGELVDINKAISFLDQATLSTSEEHPSKPESLNALGVTLMNRFLREGELADIDRAVSCQNNSILLAPNEHASKPAWLNNLACSLWTRFERLRNIADIDMSIKHLDQAVLLTTKEHSGLPKYLNNLASSLQIRSETLKGLHDLDRAIECLELAVALTPDENTDKPSWLSNLGVALMRRFDIVGAPVDINRAVDRQNRAVLLTPDTDTAKSVWLNNLGLSLVSRFEHSRDMPDLDQAIIYLDQAVRLTSVDGAARTRWASNLGSALRTRFRHLNEDSDLKQSIEAFKEAAQSYQGDPLLRFTAACSWARLSSQANEPTSLEAYKLAMGLVPRIVWLGNTVEDRYRDIPAIRNVALEAAAIAIEFQAHDLAVEWLEEGRSIVWQQRLQILNPMEDLRRANHELAERLKNVAIQISLAEMAKQTVDISHDASSHEQSAQQHRRLAEKWDKLLRETRLLDGFNDFLQPKKLPWLTGAAHSGAVAIVNLHKKRADMLAILPNSTNVIHIPLRNFSYDHAVQLRDRLFGSLRHGNLPNRGDRRPVFHDEESDNTGFEDILAALWTQVVQPVFEALGYTERLPMDELPRLTWCTTGPLSFLPLHAAGCYDTPGPENRAFRYAITSYTPILAALIRPVPSPHDFRGVLAVGQSSTTGQLPLPGTVQEIEMIVKHVGSQTYKRLAEDNATVSSVLEAMREHSWVHFACHATQNPAEPTSSAFYLHDGPLDLAEITKKTLPNASFAFLSACQTALGDENLPDESIHLAAGLNMAGYPTLIATMWSIKDEHGPIVADHVYAALFRDGIADSSKVAVALHKAGHYLRAQVGEKDFSSWVPFIHIGL